MSSEVIKNGRGERTSPAASNNNRQAALTDLTPETSDDDFRKLI